MPFKQRTETWWTDGRNIPDIWNIHDVDVKGYVTFI